MTAFKCGFVAIVGWPNVGKSSLLNSILKTKLSIVSPKPQTTRESILGIVNEEGIQMIFSDTPGWLNPQDPHQTLMKKSVMKSLHDDADVILWVVETQGLSEDQKEFAEKIAKLKKPTFVAINKIDKKPEFKTDNAFPNEFKVFSLSAKTGQGVNKLKTELIQSLPEQPAFYPTDVLTDRWERFFAAELIREKIFEITTEEVPHACLVEITEFNERKDRKDHIKAIIHVETEGQKRILIGNKGTGIRHLGEQSRHDIEARLGRPIYLELVVKVKKGWRKDIDFMKQIRNLMPFLALCLFA